MKMSMKIRRLSSIPRLRGAASKRRAECRGRTQLRRNKLQAPGAALRPSKSSTEQSMDTSRRPSEGTSRRPRQPRRLSSHGEIGALCGRAAVQPRLHFGPSAGQLVVQLGQYRGAILAGEPILRRAAIAIAANSMPAIAEGAPNAGDRPLRFAGSAPAFCGLGALRFAGSGPALCGLGAHDLRAHSLQCAGADLEAVHNAAVAAADGQNLLQSAAPVASRNPLHGFPG